MLRKGKGFKLKITTCFSVVFGSPGGRVDVDVIGIEAESSGLHGVIHNPIEHPDTADAGVEGDADAAVAVVGDRSHLACAASAVLVVAVVLRHGVVVIAVDVGRSQRIVIGPRKMLTDVIL